MTRTSATQLSIKSAQPRHRKLDWRHYEGVAWLLCHGADPNRISYWGHRALDHALGRTSPLRYFQLLLDHRADPTLPSADGTLPAALAARTGRADVLDLFAKHGFPVALTGDDAFLAACARADEAAARAFTAGEPGLVERLQAETSKESWFEADIHRLAGRIELLSPKPDVAKAEGCFEQALAIARAGGEVLGAPCRNEHGSAMARSRQAAAGS